MPIAPKSNPKKITKLFAILSGIALITSAGSYIWNYAIASLTGENIGYFVFGSMILLVMGFGRKVWSKIGPQLEKDAVEATASWLDNTLRYTFSRFRRRYCQEMVYEHRFFNVHGLRVRSNFTLELERVFVDLRIAPSTNNDPGLLSFLIDEDIRGSKPMWEFLRILKRKGAGKAPAFAVIGPPGCGKTTLLQHLTLIFCQNKQRSLKLPAYVPVLLFLREHIEAITDSQRS